MRHEKTYTCKGETPPNQTRRERSELLQGEEAESDVVASEQHSAALAVVVFIVFKVAFNSARIVPGKS